MSVRRCSEAVKCRQMVHVPVFFSVLGMRNSGVKIISVNLSICFVLFIPAGNEVDKQATANSSVSRYYCGKDTLFIVMF